MQVIVTDERRLYRESLRMLVEASEPSIEVLEAAGMSEVPSLLGTAEKRSVVLYSLSGPANNGLDALEGLRDAIPDLPVMVLCEQNDPVLARGAFARGAKAFLPATTPGPIMVAILNLVIAGGQYAPPSLFVDPRDGQRRAAASISAQLAREAAIHEAFPQLSRRQGAVLSLVSLGCSNRAVAEALDMRENTVKAHVKQIMRRLGVENRTQAALLADRLVD